MAESPEMHSILNAPVSPGKDIRADAEALAKMVDSPRKSPVEGLTANYHLLDENAAPIDDHEAAVTLAALKNESDSEDDYVLPSYEETKITINDINTATPRRPKKAYNRDTNPISGWTKYLATVPTATKDTVYSRRAGAGGVPEAVAADRDCRAAYKEYMRLVSDNKKLDDTTKVFWNRKGRIAANLDTMKEIEIAFPIIKTVVEEQAKKCTEILLVVNSVFKKRWDNVADNVGAAHLALDFLAGVHNGEKLSLLKETPKIADKLYNVGEVLSEAATCFKQTALAYQEISKYKLQSGMTVKELEDDFDDLIDEEVGKTMFDPKYLSWTKEGWGVTTDYDKSYMAESKSPASATTKKARKATTDVSDESRKRPRRNIFTKSKK